AADHHGTAGRRRRRGRGRAALRPRRGHGLPGQPGGARGPVRHRLAPPPASGRLRRHPSAPPRLPPPGRPHSPAQRLTPPPTPPPLTPLVLTRALWQPHPPRQSRRGTWVPKAHDECLVTAVVATPIRHPSRGRVRCR